MKLVNKCYVPSNTDKNKAMAHCRRLARSSKGQYDGTIECWFNPTAGKFNYYELQVGSWMDNSESECIYIGSADVHRFA